MFAKSAAYYDAIYAFKDYAGEALHVDGLIRRYARRGGKTLLDVACGTGKHLEHLRATYACEGIDLDPAMLEIARARLPEVPLHQGDMADFDLGRRFDAVICLFSAIGYMTTPERLRAAVATMVRHLEPGGVLLVEPWFTPETWKVGHVSARFLDEPGMKLARMNVSRVEGRLTPLDFHILVATPEGVEHLEETHLLALHTREEYLAAFRDAGLETRHDAGVGVDPRGLYVGVRRA